MIKSAITVIWLLIALASGAQQLYMEGGKTSSIFKYLDSNYAKLNNIHPGIRNFMSIGVTDQFFTDRLKWSSGLNYSSYGSIASIDASDVFLEWDTNYLELELGMDLKLITFKSFDFYLKGIASAGTMLQGTQTINNKVYDLKTIDSFSNTLYSFKGGIGFSYKILTNLSVYSKYIIGKSTDLEKGDGEKLNIVSGNLGFGLLINLKTPLRSIIVKSSQN